MAIRRGSISIVLALVLAPLATACGGGAARGGADPGGPDLSADAYGETSPTPDSGAAGDADRDATTGTDADVAEADSPSPAILPSLTDWACPVAWTRERGFVDEVQSADVPKGMQQFTTCRHPDAWDGPSGPALLKSWTCPSGWQPVVHPTLLAEGGLPLSWCQPPRVARIRVPGGNEDGTDYLTPAPEGANEADWQTCDVSAGLMPKLWDTGCVHIGDACPAGDFPEVPASVAGGRVYVKAGSVGGTGALASPFATIAEAVAAAQAGDVVVVAEGTYGEPLAPDKPLTIWGACVEKVRIADTTTTAPGVATLTLTHRLALRNVALSSTSQGIRVVAADGGTGLEASGVLVLHATRRALYVVKGTARLSGSLLLSTRVPSGSTGRGVQVDPTGDDPGTFEATGTIIEDMTYGAYAYGNDSPNATVRLTDVLVRSGRRRGTDQGAGVGAKDRGILSLTRVLVDDMRALGILLTDSSQATLTDVVVQGTRPMVAAQSQALLVKASSSAVVERGLFLDNYVASILLNGAGTTIDLTDVVVDGTKLDPYGNTRGVGMIIEEAASAKARRVVLQGNHLGGLFLDSKDSSFEAVDLVSIDNLPVKAGSDGGGMYCRGGPRAVVERVLIEGNSTVGVLVTGAGTTWTGTDVVIRDTTFQPKDDQFGRGIDASDGASVTASRLVVTGNQQIGISISSGATLHSTDVAVLDMKPAAQDIGAGYCLVGNDSGSIEVARGRFERCIGLGVMAFGAVGTTEPEGGPHVTIEDAVVRDVLARDESGGLGTALGLVDGGSATLTRVLVDRGYGIGIDLALGARLQATDLVVRAIRSGASVAALGSGGWGLLFDGDAGVRGERVLVEGCRDAGVVFAGAAESTLEDLTVRGTTPCDCELLPATAPESCLAEEQSAVSRGISVLGPSRVALAAFDLDSNGTMGVQLMIGTAVDGTSFATGPTLALDGGRIARHEIGVNAQDALGFTGDVTYVDDTVAVGSTPLQGPRPPVVP